MNRLIAAASTLLALVAALPASAGVIYRWQDVAPNPNTGPFEGLIEFSDDAWSANGHLSSSTSDGDGFVPIKGVERFHWANPGAVGIRHTIDLAMGQCNSWELMGLCESDDIVLLPNSDAMSVEFDLTFGALLGGNMWVGLGHSALGMSASGPLWTIDWLATDWDGICRLPQDGLCFGSTGVWVLDLSTLPLKNVPEPSTIALLMLALSALLGCRLFTSAPT
jgi:hypothetical protein